MHRVYSNIAMKKILLFALTFLGSCKSDVVKKDDEILFCDTTKEKQIEVKDMKICSLYPDSLTFIQRKCVEKAYSFNHDPKFESWEVGPWSYQTEGYMTEEEKDAIAELSIWDYRKKYKSIDESIFKRRFKEVFGYNFESFSKFCDLEKTVAPVRAEKITNSLISIFSNPYRNFYISKKEKIIIDYFSFGISFDDSNDIKTFLLPSRMESGVRVGTIDNPIYFSSMDYLFHLNNYFFHEAGASRTWLIVNDKYFMSHLLIEYGYDGDNDINKMVLMENKRKNMEIIDVPLSSFHIYPDGKLKILDNLLNTAAELSTADTSDYFSWATSVIDSFCVYSRRSGFELNDAQNDSENSYDYASQIKNLTLSQRRELVAHIVNYMQPVYEKYLGTDMGYGNVDSDLGDMRILDCFWNYMMGDHEVIAEIEDNNYYGLSNLQALIEKMKEFKPFYNSKTGAFEPWAYVPLRYQTLEEN